MVFEPCFKIFKNMFLSSKLGSRFYHSPTIDLNVHSYLINETIKTIKLVGYTNCNNQLKLKIMII